MLDSTLQKYLNPRFMTSDFIPVLKFLMSGTFKMRASASGMASPFSPTISMREEKKENSVTRFPFNVELEPEGRERMCVSKASAERVLLECLVGMLSVASLQPSQSHLGCLF